MADLGKILIIDDNEDVLFALNLLLKTHCGKVKAMRSPERIVHFMTDFRPDIVLLDMNFTRDTVSGEEGMECLQTILKLDPNAVVVMMTAYADTEKAVQAIKAGATDFVSKPWDNGKLLATLHAAMKLRRSQADAIRLKERVEALSAEREEACPELIGESDCMKRVADTVAQIGDTDVHQPLLEAIALPFEHAQLRFRVSTLSLVEDQGGAGRKYPHDILRYGEYRMESPARDGIERLLQHPEVPLIDRCIVHARPQDDALQELRPPPHALQEHEAPVWHQDRKDDSGEAGTRSEIRNRIPCIRLLGEHMVCRCTVEDMPDHDLIGILVPDELERRVEEHQLSDEGGEPLQHIIIVRYREPVQP